MTLISVTVKENILKSLNNILNMDEPNWMDLELDLRLKILHNMCNVFKPNYNIENIGNLSIPLKNQRPKKIIELAGINNNSYTDIYCEFKKKLIEINRDFRNSYNSKNKKYCFANIPIIEFEKILTDYNYKIYLFLDKHKNLINSKKFFYNLIGNNNEKIIYIEQKDKNIKIEKINYKDKFLNFNFNNGVSIQLELYLTSEKITSNIPAKYKIFLKNIF